jgi:1-deoxy-D-xylulose-5-phosphate synthase
MGAGTGLEYFGKRFARRYFDVGIAEAHALTFSAGLAAAGYKPHVAIYSTFLQRGYDNIIHDIALQNLPVRIMIDRAGLAPADGATHHGIFDVAFLSHIPDIEVYAPASFDALSRLVDNDNSKPTAIRYPNATELEFVDKEFGEIPEGELPLVRSDFNYGDSKKLVFITYGNILAEVHKAKIALSARGIDTGIILVEKIKPYADSCSRICDLISSADHVVYVEEGIKNGGAAMITGNTLVEMGIDTSKTTYDIIAIDDNFAAPEQITDIYDYVGLSAKKILARCEDIINRP